MSKTPFDVFGHFENMDRRRDEWREEARQTLVPGIDPADLSAGMVVTVSPNLRTGDRSYCSELLKVTAFNAAHIQVERIGDGYGAGQKVILVLSEHHVYAADNFAA